MFVGISGAENMLRLVMGCAGDQSCSLNGSLTFKVVSTTEFHEILVRDRLQHACIRFAIVS
jgi:hypothetical protein